MKIRDMSTEYSAEEKQAKIKYVCIELLNSFAQACSDMNLTWWVDGGTLLGTMRDGKMIPWDDDIDVIMPREDYDMLCTAALRDARLFGRNFFQTSVTDSCFEVHAKLRHPNSCALTPRECCGTHNRGMFLDIFPLDNVPASKDVQRDIAAFVRTIAKHTGQEEKFETSAKFYNLNHVIKDVAIKYKNDKRVANAVYWRYDTKLISFPESVYMKETKFMSFEGIQVPVPNGAEKVLTAWYGKDWRMPQQLPTEHKAFVDPFHRYQCYNGCTKTDFERLTK